MEIRGDDLASSLTNAFQEGLSLRQTGLNDKRTTLTPNLLRFR